MTRNQFFKRSLVGSLVALVFPSLLLAKKNPGVIETQRELCSMSKEDFVRMYPLTPDECWPPDKIKQGPYVKFCLIGVYEPLHMKISGKAHQHAFPDHIFGGAGIMAVESPKLILYISMEKFKGYDTALLTYQYEDDNMPINIYIPVSRLLRDGEFRWRAVHAGDKIDLSNERLGFVIERRNDRTDIYLTS